LSIWTLTLLRETRPFLSLRSFLAYRRFLLSKPQPGDDTIALHLKPPIDRTVFLRKWGSDPDTFEEVIQGEAYRPVLEHIPRCRTMIDLGANIGLATLYLASRYRCRCLSVEPNPETFRILSKNVSGLADVLQAGVWSSQAPLAAGCANARYSMSSVASDPSGSISGLPMPAIIERSGFETVDLLKIDVEGAEVQAFQGDPSWLNQIGALAIEFHGESRRLMDFDAVMAAYGFRIAADGTHTTLAIRTPQLS
jgi:FkbM family methyltransferase